MDINKKNGPVEGDEQSKNVEGQDGGTPGPEGLGEGAGSTGPQTDPEKKLQEKETVNDRPTRRETKTEKRSQRQGNRALKDMPGLPAKVRADQSEAIAGREGKQFTTFWNSKTKRKQTLPTRTVINLIKMMPDVIQIMDDEAATDETPVVE